MAITQRRVVAIGCALIGIAALITALLVFRGRWQQRPHTDHAAIATASGATTVPRGEITIDAQRQQLIGVRLAPATRESMSTVVRTTGIVRYDETKLADVNVKLDGWIRDLYVDYTGQPVKKGQPLFTLYSPDLLTTQQEYLLALKTRETVADSAIADAREYADRVVEAARQRLRLWDIADEDIAALTESRRAPDVITFRSPGSGFVLEKTALRGMHISPGQTLYKISDLSSVWIEADVYEREIALARVGLQATVTLDAYPGESFDGRAIYIFPFVEESSRTVKVRFQFANPHGRLRPGMYAHVELTGAAGMALSVPGNAVLDSGTEQVVFVAEGEGRFVPRPVTIGRRYGDRVEIVDGLAEGEQVATSATFFLDSESQLRAGLQNYERSAPTPGGPSPQGSTLDIAFRTQPDPPSTGESVFEVVVKDASGQPVSNADVSVQFFMPAMPTMNMPAMRNETPLPSAGAGLYRGPGQVLMSGRWDVTVTVSKDGKQLGSKRLAVVTR